VLASMHTDFAAFDAERFVQRDGLEIFDGHLAGEGDDVVQLADLAHGVVEDAGDDAAVAVAGRSGIALAEAEAADESLALFVEDEFEAHAVGIIHAADEAVILLQLHVASIVAVNLGLRWHGGILRDTPMIIEGQKRNFSQKRREWGTGARRKRGSGRDPSTAVVLRLREARPPLRMTEM